MALALSLLLNAILTYNMAHTPDLAAAPTEEPGATSTESESYESGQTYPLMRVVDGDTITVGFNGHTEYVRLIGLDTPEPNDPGGPECYASEATTHLRELAQTGTVILVFDASQGTRDRYGRLLAYVELPDGTDLATTMIRDGYAHEYTYAKPYARQAVYREAENEAVQAERGLWSPETCTQ